MVQTSQNIFKIEWCSENSYINIQQKIHVSIVNFFRGTLKTKTDFFENFFE